MLNEKDIAWDDTGPPAATEPVLKNIVWDDEKQAFDTFKARHPNLYAAGRTALDMGPQFFLGQGPISRVAASLVGGSATFPAGGIAGLLGMANQAAKAFGTDTPIAKRLGVDPVPGDIDSLLAAGEKPLHAVSELPMKLLKTNEDRKAMEIIMKPIEWTQFAAKTYGDKVEHISPNLASVIASGFEALVFLGLPGLKSKLAKSVKTRRTADIQAALKEIEMARRAAAEKRLAEIKAEPKRLEKLAEAEQKIAEPRIEREGMIKEYEKVFDPNRGFESRATLEMDPGVVSGAQAVNKSPVGAEGLRQSLEQKQVEYLSERARKIAEAQEKREARRQAKLEPVSKSARESANVFADIEYANMSPQAAVRLKDRLRTLEKQEPLLAAELAKRGDKMDVRTPTLVDKIEMLPKELQGEALRIAETGLNEGMTFNQVAGRINKMLNERLQRPKVETPTPAVKRNRPDTFDAEVRGFQERAREVEGARVKERRLDALEEKTLRDVNLEGKAREFEAGVKALPERVVEAPKTEPVTPAPKAEAPKGIDFVTEKLEGETSIMMAKDGTPIGTATTKPDVRFEQAAKERMFKDVVKPDEKVHRLQDIEVSEAMRGKGHGKELFERAIDEAGGDWIGNSQLGFKGATDPAVKALESIPGVEVHWLGGKKGGAFVARKKPKQTEISATGGPIAVGSNSQLYSGLPFDAMAKLQERIGTKVWDDWAMKKIPDMLGEVPAVGRGVKAVRRALDTDYMGDLPDTPGFKKLQEQQKKQTIRGHEVAIDLGNRLQSLPEKTQMEVGEFLRGERQGVNHRHEGVAKEAQRTIIKMGKEAVDLGLLDEKTYFKNIGKYLPRLYRSKEHYSGLLERYGEKKPSRLDLDRFKARKDIPKEVRKEMGEILTPGYPVAKAIVQLTNAIETAKFFKGIASNPDWAITKGSKAKIPDNFKQLPADKKLGALSEAHVHPEIYAEINNYIRMQPGWEKGMARALGIWKYGKVVLSPKTHVRNNMSNSFLAHLGGMPMYEQPVYLAKAIKAMRDKNSPYYKAAKSEGILGTTFVDAELKGLFNSVEAQLKGTKAGGWQESLGYFANAADAFGRTGKKLGDFYQAQEVFWKIAKMIHSVERKKMTMPQAAADAQKWLFDYSKLTRFQEAYRGTGKGPMGIIGKIAGAPFATFTFKSVPRILEATIKTPHRLILPAAITYGIQEAARNFFGDTPEQAEAKKEMTPEWMQGAFMGTIPNFIRTPRKDKYGREKYLSAAYIFPWGDIASGGGGALGGLSPASMPLTKAAMEQIMNKDRFFGTPLVKDEDTAGFGPTEAAAKNIALRGGHLYRTFAPTIAADVPKVINAARGMPEDYKGRTRDLSDALLDSFLGLKFYSVDYSEQFLRKVDELHPKQGYKARKILANKRELLIKRKVLKQSGKSTKAIDKDIEVLDRQIKGLSEELKDVAGIYRKTKGR